MTENFRKSCETNIHFEESHSPWQRRLNLVYGIGVALVVALAMFFYGKGMLEVSMLIGVMLFVFDLFGPLKALYGQSTRLTVMNSCMDRIEEVFAESELPDMGSEHIPAADRLREGVPEVEFRDVSFPMERAVLLQQKPVLKMPAWKQKRRCAMSHFR